MAAEKKTKWEGKARAEIKTLKPGQVWSCLEDFCNLHKWHPNLDTCYRVDGVPGQPGPIRYCASTQPSSGSEAIKWVKERLLTLDPTGRCLSYDVVDNNMGFGSYVATMRVEAVDGDDEIGCVMEMSFVADPIGGWRLEDLVSMIDGVLQSMAKNIERAILDAV